MNKKLLICFLFAYITMSAQDHFSGISTSKNVTLLNVGLNPAELNNLSSKTEINLVGISINAADDQFGVKDLIAGKDFTKTFLNGTEPMNMRVDAEMFGPGFGIKLKKWAFGFTPKAYTKFNLIEIYPQLASAITNNGNQILVHISNKYNQRVNETAWSEMNFGVSRTLFEDGKNKLNLGATIKLLFPGSYANIGVSKFSGNLSPNLVNNTIDLSNAQASIDLTYSGSVNGLFSGNPQFGQMVYGKATSIGGDFGLNYQLKDKDSTGYRLNVGAAVRNIGSMTFNSSDNSTSVYQLSVQGLQTMDLGQFSGVKSFKDVGNVLKNSPYVTETSSSSTIKVKLPTVFSAYADIKVVPKFYVTLYTQQKLNNDQNNNQITTQNIFSVTPRFSSKHFEIFSPWIKNEISGTTGGLGFRISYFYIGSSSAITMLTKNDKQADVYFGFRFGIK